MFQRFEDFFRVNKSVIKSPSHSWSFSFGAIKYFSFNAVQFIIIVIVIVIIKIFFFLSN